MPSTCRYKVDQISANPELKLPGSSMRRATMTAYD